MKMPEPIMVPTMWQVAARRPKSLFRLTVEAISGETTGNCFLALLSYNFILPVDETPRVSTSLTVISLSGKCRVVKNAQ